MRVESECDMGERVDFRWWLVGRKPGLTVQECEDQEDREHGLQEGIRASCNFPS